MVVGAGLMTIDATNYLDLGNIYYNELVGAFGLGLVLGILAIILISSRLKFHPPVTLGACFLWIAASFTYNQGFLFFWVFSVYFVSAFFYYVVQSAIKR